MNSRKKIIILIVIASSVLFYCAKKPNYSKSPQISFKSFNILSKDSALFTISFSDGDGDIGGGPVGEGNFYLTYYFWENDINMYNVYKDTTFLNDTIDARTFPSPSDAYKNKPISGEIAILLSPYRKDNSIKKLKLSCFIKDNAGNKSNIITTPELNAP